MTGERTGAENVAAKEFFRVLREQRVVIVLTVVFAAAAATAYSTLRDPEYTAEASISFADQSEDFLLLGTPAAPSQQPEKKAAANAENVTRPRVAERVKRELGSPEPAAELAGRVETRVEPDTNLVVISAKGKDAEFTARLANAFARQTEEVLTRETRAQFKAAARDLRRQLPRAPADSREPPTASENARLTERAALNERITRLESLAAFSTPVQIARAAQTPDAPSSPKPIRDTALSILLGLIFGILLAFLRSSLDRRLLSSRQIEEELDLPVVAHVRREALGLVNSGSNGRDKLAAADLEAFRILRLNVRFLDIDKPARSLIVTSAMPEEGKSTVAASLAYANALSGKRTLLVETDLRRASLAGRLGLDSAPGLTDYLLGNATPKEVLQPVTFGLTPSVEGGAGTSAPASLVCITGGSPFPRPTELLASDRLQKFVQSVVGAYEMVVFDSPPLLPVGDTLELIPFMDAVLLCVRESQTTHEQGQAAAATLAHLPKRPIGVVVTGVTPGSDSEYGYYSYSYMGAPRPEEESSRPAGDAGR